MRLPFPLLSLVTAVLIPSTQASSSIRNPIGALSSVQNATIHAHNGRLTALSQFDLTFNIRDELYVKLSLEPNHDILAQDATVTYLAADGSVSRKESVNRLGHKVFKGSAWVQRPSVGEDRWQRVGWSRVIVKEDGQSPLFEGAFSVNHDHHHVQSSTNYMRTRHARDPEIDWDERGRQYMVVWRDSDILPQTPTGHQELRRAEPWVDVPQCQADILEFNLNPSHPVYLGMSRTDPRAWGPMDFTRVFRRQIDTTSGGNSAGVDLVSTIGQTSGCPSTNKVALVGVATDCTYTAAFATQDELQQNVINQMNAASAVWEDSFRISLGLANITISDSECPGTPAQATRWNQGCSDSVDIQQRLNYFSAWRGTQQDDNSHWTLLSTCNTGSAVGLAWLGQACINTAMDSNNSFTGSGSTGNTETVSGANVVIRTSGANEWQIIAHETGHTYGAVHDCTDQTCADANYVNAQQCCPLSADTCDAGAQYIMNPSTAQGISTFSLCTIGNICSAIGRRSVNTDCLSDNKNVVTFTGPRCGNGIVETGEECDCGGDEGCGDDSCCDPSTCTFRDGAVCDDANEDCCDNCQFRSQGSVCRASQGDCDPQEVCPGDGGNCPPDTTTPDGESCGNGLQCASGQCTSRDQQCQTVMGSYTRGNSNDTSACDSQGCVISCAAPEFGYGTCYGLQQNFLDGTECGGGGHCQNGQCVGSTVGGEVKSWIDDHKPLVIGIASAIGALLLFSILGCLCRSRRRRKWNKRVASSPPQAPPGGWQGWNGRRGGGPQMEQSWNGPPPPQMSHPPAGGWYNPTMSGARGSGGRNMGWDTPPPPPPAYTASNRGLYA